MDRKISYPDAHNLSKCAQPIRMRTTYPHVCRGGGACVLRPGTVSESCAPQALRGQNTPRVQLVHDAIEGLANRLANNQIGADIG